MSKRPYQAQKSAALTGKISIPGDKSISHRALIFGALSIGRTNISGLLLSEDVLATARAVEALGAQVFEDKDTGIWTVTGRGVGGLRQPDNALDFGNAGTGVRLMMGVIAGYAMSVRMTGDASLSRRPMGRVLTPLRQMGIQTDPADQDQLPLTLVGNRDLLPLRYTLPVASAQVKSAILFAGLHTAGKTTVVEPEPTRDHTERMIRYFGGVLDIVETEFGREITVHGHAELIGRDVVVPADPSSAAFPVAAALISPGSDLTIKGVLINPARTGFYLCLKEMGADIKFENERQEAGETVADIVVRSASLAGERGLKGIDVPATRVPSMVDEYPMLAALAAYAAGTTRMRGLGELRVKESDRLRATADGLARNGVDVRVEGDDLVVEGTGKVPGGGFVTTDLDHRIAMAFLTLGLGAQSAVTVDDVTMVDTSFPAFVPLMSRLGAQMKPAAKG